MVNFTFNTLFEDEKVRRQEEREAIFTEREEIELGHKEYSSLNYIYPNNSIQRDEEKLVYLDEELIRDGVNYDFNPDRYLYHKWQADNDLGNDLYKMNAYCLIYVDYFLFMDTHEDGIGINPYEGHFLLKKLVMEYDNPPIGDVGYEAQKQK